MPSEWRAAVFGSQYQAWRRKANAPLWIPRRYKDISPPSQAMLDGVLQSGSTSRRRQTCYAVLHDVPAFDRYSANGHATCNCSCGCCVTYSKALSDVGHRPVGSFKGVDFLRSHAPGTIRFDPDSWVTTVEESAEFDLSALSAADAARRVENAFDAASPENWANPAFLAPEDRETPFFVRSIPQRRKGKELVEFDTRSTDSSSGPRHRRPSPFDLGATHLLETTAWNWNFGGQSQAGADIILNIYGYDRSDVAIDANVRADRPGTDGDRHLKFGYGLHRCVSYDIGPIVFRDILDTDDGRYSAVYSSRDRTLRVKASKSIHFRPPSRGDQDEVALLNLLAPAVTSMLVRELVWDGTTRALEAPARVTVDGYEKE